MANQKRLVHHVVAQSVELDILKGETKLPMPWLMRALTRI